MFSVQEYLMKEFRGMIGNYPDFQVREFSANWYARGKLTEENLAELDALIEAQYIVPEVPQEEVSEVIEEQVEIEPTKEEQTEIIS